MITSDNWETHWSNLNQGATLNAAVRYRQSLILRCMRHAIDQPKCILDVGSGTGDLIEFLAARNIGQKKVGLELSASGVSIAQRKVPNALFIQGDMYSPPSMLKELESQVDLILCSEVIEHLDDPLKFLINIKQYLAPTGKILLTVPGGPLHEFARMIGHRQHFTKLTINELLKESGFSIDKIYLAGFPFFNLYRILCGLRGKKLHADLAHVSSLFKIANPIFNLLLKCTWDNSPFGWQIAAIASHA